MIDYDDKVWVKRGQRFLPIYGFRYFVWLNKMGLKDTLEILMMETDDERNRT